MSNTTIPEEQGASGQSTGIELEDIGDIDQPFDPDDIDVITKPMTIDLLLSRIKSGGIHLQPDFQRRWGIWDTRRQSRLIESLLLRIPVPSLYAAEDSNEDWEVVDGVQRLFTIAHFMDAELVDETPLMLSNLKTLPVFNGRDFDALPLKLQRRLRETELVVHVIRKGTPPAVKFSIFERINTGSVVLSAQELRHAITPGPGRKWLERLAASNEFKSATVNSVKPDRMGDRELALRFAAFRLTSYNNYRVQDLDAFLLATMGQLNVIESNRLDSLEIDFKRSMNAARRIFGLHAFRKWLNYNASRYPINKALFEAISVSLAELSPNHIERLVQAQRQVQEKYIELCNLRDFESAVSQSTGDPSRVKRRFEMIAELFRGF